MDSVNGFFPPEKSQRVFSNLSCLVLLNGNLVHFAPGVTRLDRAEHSNHTKVGPKPPNRCAVHTGVTDKWNWLLAASQRMTQYRIWTWATKLAGQRTFFRTFLLCFHYFSDSPRLLLRQIWPMSVVNVLMWLMVTHFGLLELFCVKIIWIKGIKTPSIPTHPLIHTSTKDLLAWKHPKKTNYHPLRS